jgi:hypothetical protein
LDDLVSSTVVAPEGGAIAAGHFLAAVPRTSLVTIDPAMSSGSVDLYLNDLSDGQSLIEEPVAGSWRCP